MVHTVMMGDFNPSSLAAWSWGSTVVSAPPLFMGHPLASAREAAQEHTSLPRRKGLRQPLCYSTMALHFYGALGFFNEHSWLQNSSLPSFQAVSLQPAAVLSPNPMFQHPAPAHSSGYTSHTGAIGYGTDHLCRSHSVWPTTNSLLGCSLSPQSPPTF